MIGKKDGLIHKIKSWLLIVLQLMLVCLFLYVLWLAFYPYNPMRVDYIKVYQKEVIRGDVIHFQVIGQKFMNTPAFVSIELVNSERFLIMNYYSNQPVGDKFPLRSFIVPRNIHPDNYHIAWTAFYEVNQFQKVVRTGVSEFILVK